MAAETLEGKDGSLKEEKKKKDKHAQRFLFRVHYSGVPGEPELRAGVDSCQVKGWEGGKKKKKKSH